MTKTLRLLLLTAAVATVALGGGVARAMACGNNGGYSYAGIGAPTHAYGVSALISPLDAFDVLNAEDYELERFFVEVRHVYWAAPENSPRRALAQALIDKLEF